MDGLVLDTEITYFSAWRQALVELKYDLNDAFFLSLSGLHYQDVEKNILNSCEEGFDLEKFRLLSTQYWYASVDQQGISVKKGFFKLLAKLNARSTAYCLATNSYKKNALECLKFAGLEDIFSVIIARDQVKQGKPFPDIFEAAAKALTVSSSQCLILEDSKPGIEAAVNAGAISVFIPSVFPVDRKIIKLADYFFNDLGELAEIIY